MTEICTNVILLGVAVMLWLWILFCVIEFIGQYEIRKKRKS